MARTCLRAKARSKPKFSTRAYNRCPVCGRARGYIRQFKMCRICFRKYASLGQIPGVTKSSW
jgi:small subunit ribosomal protein S14